MEIEQFFKTLHSNFKLEKITEINLFSLLQFFLDCDNESKTDFSKFGTLDYIQENYNNENKKPNLFYLVHYKQTLIGFLNVNLSKIKDKRANVFVYIANNYRKKGYGTELITLLKEIIFCNCGLVKMECTFINYNIPHGFLTRLGLEKEVEKREAIFRNGTYFNCITFGISNLNQWEAKNE